MTASRTAPAVQVPLISAVTATIASPLTKSTQRSAYRTNRSASMDLATTSPGGVSGSRYCRVCPCITDIRIRSSTSIHQRGYTPRAREMNSGCISRSTASATSRPTGSSPVPTCSTVRPHRNPVTAPCAATRLARRNSTAPNRPHFGRMNSACSTPRARLGPSPGRGQVGRGPGPTAAADRVGLAGTVSGRARPSASAVSDPASRGCRPATDRLGARLGSGVGLGSRPPGRPATRRSRRPPAACGTGPGMRASDRAAALLHHAAVIEHGHEAGPLDGAEPVRDQHAGAPGEQPVGRGHDARLGERVHPRGRLVEHHELHVAHEEPGERDELLLARRQRGAAGAEEGVEAVGQACRPSRSGRAHAPRLDVGTRERPRTARCSPRACRR